MKPTQRARWFSAIRFGIFSILLCRVSTSQVLAQHAIDYQREIQPIFAEHCSHCHGADASTRQGGLRLDVREAALVGGESGKPAISTDPAVVSHLLERIESADPDSIMPPPSLKKPLSKDQIQRIKQWIAEGAPFAEHWAFVTPKKISLPGTPTNDHPAVHPIDQIVMRELARRDWSPSEKEKSNTLCRRLYLDLIGLPPTPDEVQEFEKNGVEATVDQLLNSERFGEKWARHWLDVARYSDTNGYEKDLRREQWAWRDWVIQAINDDMPYNQFLIEQLAGDLLPDATQSQWIATGFLRNSMLNEEGAIVPEQFRMVEMFDRLDCIGKAVLGMTTQCAQCHNHKFDPLSQEEYYGMMSFLNNTYEAQSWVYTPDQQLAREATIQKIAAIYDRVRTSHVNWEKDLADWRESVQASMPTWTPVSMNQLESVSGLNHPVQLDDHSILMLGHTSGDVFFVGSPSMDNVTGLQLEILNHGDLPFRGPGRSNLGTWDIAEIEVLTQAVGSNTWEKQKLVDASADFSEAEVKQDDKKATGPVQFLIDGSDDKRWQADRGIGLRNQSSVAVVRFEKPLTLPNGSKFKFVMRMGKMVGCCRVSLTQSPSPAAPPVNHRAVLAMTGQEDPCEIELDPIFTSWVSSLPDSKPIQEEIANVWKYYPKAETSVLHLKERTGRFQRSTHRLERGEWDQPKQIVEPHTPKFLHHTDSIRTRLDFAKWIASDQSPLTARVAVNRVWQALFGEGLVETAEDFGTRAPVPEHLSLLDWLSVTFMENGWSHKKLIKHIVLSDTYQRSSRATSNAIELDPKNRWLTRGPRFRCDAETVRDIAMSVAGIIHHRVGGPSVIPPVPQNVLDYNYVYPSYWTPTTGAERYRRTLYAFRKRSMPDPLLSNFDSPNGDIACARRVRSNTPLAALAGLNETIFVESAQALALRILREGGDADATRVNYGFQLCTSRLPTDAERNSILTFVAKERKRIADGWLSAREIATGDPAKVPSLPKSTTPQDAAVWTLTSRVLLNLDETISKN
jgi:mono/diheme cytochrome c family protein